MKQSLEWSPENLMKLKSISDVQLSPDHSKALFVVTETLVGKEKGQKISRIYRSNTSGGEDGCSFTRAECSSTQPRWSPSGEWIAFLSDREGIDNLYLIRSDGGEAAVLTNGRYPIQTFQWSPDGETIAFVREDELEDEKKSITTSLAYEYKKEKRINRLWVLAIFSSTREAKALTADRYCIRSRNNFLSANCEFDWSPDSKKITFAYNSDSGRNSFYLESSIATVTISTGDTISWEKKALYEALPRYSPDGESIAYLCSDSSQNFAINRQVAVRSKNGSFIRLLAPTREEGAYIQGPSILGWTSDSRNIVFFEPKHTKYCLTCIPSNGESVSQIQTGDSFFTDPSLSRDRSMLGFTLQSPSDAPEACIAKLDSFIPHQISHLNQMFKKYPPIKTESVTWTSENGVDIEGLLTFPLNYDSTKKYPLLLMIHGGPMGFFDESFLGNPGEPYPLPAFAEKGFFIFRPNPRGSCGYGKDFRCALYGDWGGKDFVDILTGVDALIEKGMVDPERLGVMGWSYGGYMAAWIITQTDRFQAASLGAGLYNLQSMSGTTDLHGLLKDYFGDFTTHMKLYQERSPINHALNIQVPCLIQHGVEDTNVPVSQAYEFYHALDQAGNKPTLLLYPKMGHDLEDPNMYLDAMNSNLSWFEHLLKKN